MLVEVGEIVGETLSSIENKRDELIFNTESGKTYRMWHSQDCCESVILEDICGDLNDLVGSPILQAEEISGETPNDYRWEYEPESYTWTFYKFATNKGSVTLRWLGESNGYYSESVDFNRIR